MSRKKQIKQNHARCISCGKRSKILTSSGKCKYCFSFEKKSEQSKENEKEKKENLFSSLFTKFLESEYADVIGGVIGITLLGIIVAGVIAIPRIVVDDYIAQKCDCNWNTSKIVSFYNDSYWDSSKTSAIYCFVEKPDKEFIPLLLEALKESDLRESATYALSSIGIVGFDYLSSYYTVELAKGLLETKDKSKQNAIMYELNGRSLNFFSEKELEEIYKPGIEPWKYITPALFLMHTSHKNSYEYYYPEINNASTKHHHKIRRNKHKNYATLALKGTDDDSILARMQIINGGARLFTNRSSYNKSDKISENVFLVPFHINKFDFKLPYARFEVNTQELPLPLPKEQDLLAFTKLNHNVYFALQSLDTSASVVELASEIKKQGLSNLKIVQTAHMGEVVRVDHAKENGGYGISYSMIHDSKEYQFIFLYLLAKGKDIALSEGENTLRLNVINSIKL